MDGLRYCLVLLTCWVAYATVEVEEEIDVEEGNKLTMQCHHTPIAQYTIRYWIKGQYSRLPDENEWIYEIYPQQEPIKKNKSRTDMTCDNITSALTINKVQIVDDHFTCITNAFSNKRYTWHEVLTYKIGKLEMTGLENDTYKQNQAVTATCKFAEFYPDISPDKLKLTWGTRECQSTKVSEDTDTYFTYKAAKTHNLTSDDNGTKVTCSVVPGPWYDVQPQYMTLNVLYPPNGTISLNINDTNPFTHEDVLFTCDYDRQAISANPIDFKVKWMNKAQEVPEWSGKDSVVLKDVNGKHHNGSYSCYLSNSAGDSSASSAMLWVKDEWKPQRPPTLSFSNPSPYHKDSVNFTCEADEVDARPKVTNVEWLKDGVPLTDWPVDKFNYTMVVDWTIDSGNYRCKVRNVAGFSSPSVANHLEVSQFYRARNPPNLVISNTTANQRENVTFACDASELDANPSVSLVNWTRDDKALDWPNLFEVTLKVMFNDSGNFRCRAGNLAGYSPFSAPTELNITEFYAPYGQPFLIVDNANARQYDSLVFNCSFANIDAHPSVNQFKWSKNGEPLDEWKASTHTVTSLDSERDNGTYKCFVGNIIGFSPSAGSKEIKISPFYGASGKPTLSIQPMHPTEGDEVTFDCDITDVDGNPKPITWLHNSSHLQWDTSGHVVVKVKASDAGAYACQVVNDIASSELSNSVDLLIKAGSGDDGGGGKSSNTGAIVGGIIGGLALIAIVTAIILIILVKKRRAKPEESPHQYVNSTEMRQQNNNEDDYNTISPSHPVPGPRGIPLKSPIPTYANLDGDGQPSNVKMNQSRPPLNYGAADYAQVNKPPKVQPRGSFTNDTYAQVVKPGYPAIPSKPKAKSPPAPNVQNDEHTLMYAELELPQANRSNQGVNQARGHGQATAQPMSSPAMTPLEEGTTTYAEIDFSKKDLTMVI